jgi:hypothetical protein
MTTAIRGVSALVVVIGRERKRLAACHGKD